MAREKSRSRMDQLKLPDDEEEMLKLQEQFLASKERPAATVKKVSEKRKSEEMLEKPVVRDVVHMDTLPAVASTLNPLPAKKSRFQAEREKRKAVDFEKTHPDHEKASDVEKLMDDHEKGFAVVLSNIIERDTRNAVFRLPAHSIRGFPLVVENSHSTKADKKKGSLFAQQVAKKGLKEFGIVTPQEKESMDVCDEGTSTAVCIDPSGASRTVPDTSHIIDGQGLSMSCAREEAQSIHRENLAKMEEMSEDEILTEQEKLLGSLDPGLVAFLKSRSKASSAKSDQREPKEPQKGMKHAQPTAKKTTQDLPEALPKEVIGKWTHMDKVEYDKLEWMKDLPPPSIDDTQTGTQARFDFQGNFMAFNADMPVYTGLHHHGEEPERAGYSVGELFQLARSTNIQQRTLALSTLANIMKKAKGGYLDNLIQNPIFPSFIDGGIIFLLRWACDDSVEAAVVSAVSALNALLCNPADEEALTRVCAWHQGQSLSSLAPISTLQAFEQDGKEQEEENKAEETDAEVAKRDLIQALVCRMHMLQRLFYILNVFKPQAPTVVSILAILTRVARHSTQMAYEISRHKQLMDLIFQQFLPSSWESQAQQQKAVSSVYGRPLAAAMRLVGSLCQAGRHIASTIVSSYPLSKFLMTYLSGGIPLSAMELESLQKESLITWRIALSYGLLTELYITMFTNIMEQLRNMTTRLSDMSQQEPTSRDVYFMSVLEGVLPAAAIPHVKPSFNQGDRSATETNVRAVLNWDHVQGLLLLATVSAKQCLNHLAENYTQQKPCLQFSTVCVNFLATYVIKQERQPSVDVVSLLECLEELCTETLVPFLKSWGFTSIVSKLSASSNILSSSEFKRREVCDCLPELGCDVQDLRVPVVSMSSPFGFLLGLTRLVYAVCKLHKGLVDQTVSAILDHEHVISYLRRVTACPLSDLVNNHFTRLENMLHFYLIRLSLMVKPSERPPMMHQLALDVMSRLQDGDESVAHELLSLVLFNTEFIRESKEEELAAASIADMNLSTKDLMKSVTQEEINTSRCQLLRKSAESLPVIRESYFKTFASKEKKLAQSRSCYLQHVQDVTSLMVGRWDSCLLPQDWVFMPLVELYNTILSVFSQSQMMIEFASVRMVSSVLQWVYLLENWRSRSLSHVSLSLKVSRIMCVYLMGDKLFMETSIHPYLLFLYRAYTTPRMLRTLNFDERIPGISSFYDLYMQFTDQFQAVSLGDPLFSAFVLLPMQQHQNLMLRRAVWQEKSEIIRFMRLSVSEMLIDINQFLQPDETDIKLLQLYCQSLLKGDVRSDWCPILFIVAVHHVNHFLFNTQDCANSDIRKTLWYSVLRCQDEDLRETIIRFKQVNTQNPPTCMELYQQLPPSRMATAAQHQTSSSSSSVPLS